LSITGENEVSLGENLSTVCGNNQSIGENSTSNGELEINQGPRTIQQQLSSNITTPNTKLEVISTFLYFFEEFIHISIKL
jgi:hypothetical protein